MTIEESIVEVDRLMHIGQVGHLHQGIAIIDPRPAVIVAAIVLGLEASTSKEDWRSHGNDGNGEGDGCGNGIGFGYDGKGNGHGCGYGYGVGLGSGSVYGSGVGCGYGSGRGNGYGSDSGQIAIL